MNSKDLHELPVLSIESGEKLGTLARTYLDGPEKRLAGFAFTESGGFRKVESEPNIDTKDVRTLGPDALIVDRRESIHGDTVNAFRRRWWWSGGGGGEGWWSGGG